MMFPGKTIKTFRKALESVYLKQPCQTLPNALWKTLAKLPECEVVFDIKQDKVIRLEIKTKDSIYLYWHKENKLLELTSKQAKTLKFALIHQRYLNSFPLELLIDRNAFFRLIFDHREQSVQLMDLPEGFTFTKVDIEQDLSEVVFFLRECYPGWKFSAKRVLSWVNFPVHDPKLWIWVIDEEDDCPAALGIADVDLSVQEASLEWIQVHPEYRGLGIGKNLVCELLGRVQGRVSFTTVSGDVDNPANPEKLYRQCGFTGNDIWWVLRP